MSENDENPPKGGEVVSIEEARQKNLKAAEEKKDPQEAAADPLGGALQPIMAAIARELAGLAGPDGKVSIDGLSADDQSKAKTQALLRGLGQGLGEVLAQAMTKWADKVDLKFTVPSEDQGSTIQATPVRTPQDPPPGADDPTKK